MDPRQEAALQSDGDGYHQRNHAGIGTIADPVFDALTLIHSVKPITSVLEIGCTTGFRLNKVHKSFGALAIGIEASPAAIAEGRDLYPDIELVQGVAPRDLPSPDTRTFDVVVLGHFQYLLPRSDLFELAYRVDRLLGDGGHIVATDFFYNTAMSAEYAHTPDLEVFKEDPTSPWTWSPTYTLVSRSTYSLASDLSTQRDEGNWQTLDVVRKHSIAHAYPRRANPPSIHAAKP